MFFRQKKTATRSLNSGSLNYQLLDQRVLLAGDLACVEFSAGSFAETGEISLSVVDPNATGPITVTVQSSSGDSELLTLTDDGTGQFTGTINSANAATALGDGTLQVVDNDILVATYLDSDNGLGEAVTVTDSATIFRDEHGNDATTATAINFPLIRSGEIDFVGDQDWFSFSASVEMEYDFTINLGSLETSTLTIFDSDGQVALQPTLVDDSTGAIFFQPVLNGDYFLVLESNGNQLGTYLLTGTENVRPSTVELSADVYRDDETIRVSVVEPNGTGPVVVTLEASSGDTETLILDPNGAVNYNAAINSATGLPRSEDGTLQVAQGDTITVTYADPDDGLGGTSTVTDNATIQLDDYGNSFEDATPLVAPFSVAGNLEVLNDEDWFVFNATEGVQYELGFTRRSLSFGELTLYDTDGVTVLEATRFSSLISWEAPATGKYYLSVDGSTLPRTGTYEVAVTVSQSTVEFANPDFGQSGPIGVNVVDPFSSGPLLVTIEASSGDSETLTLDADSVTEFSGVIDSVSGPASPGDGTLQISVGDTLTVTYLDLDNGVGGTFESTDTAGVVLDDHGSNFADATQLNTSLDAEGRIDFAGDEDWFVFTAFAGLNYEFEADGSFPNSNTFGELSLYDTDGTTLFSFDDSTFAQTISWSAPADGEYYIAVGSSSDFGSIGTYALTGAIVLGDDHADSASNATSLDPLSGDSVPGRIETGEDEDWFTFTAVAGTKYRFEANGDSPFTNENGVLSLYDTDGITELEANGSSGRQVISWLAPADGDYFLSIASFFTSFGFGTYEVTATLNDDHGDSADFATAFDPLSSVLGELETSDDEDWFTFTAVAGTKYEFSANGSSPFTNNRGELNLFDTDGVTLLQSDDTSNTQTISWTAPTDGDYFLSVDSFFTSFGFGTYELTGMVAVDDHGDNPASATRVGLSFGVSRDVLGELENAEDEDWFAFNAIAGAEYRFESSGGSPFTNTFGTLTLYDTDGIARLEFSDSAFNQNFSWVAPATGEYFLAVGADSNFTFGTYELTLSASIPETSVSFIGSPSLDLGPIEVKVVDFDFPAEVEVTITASSGDSETLVIAGAGAYSTIINSAPGPVIIGDGSLQLAMGDSLTISYVDFDFGNFTVTTLSDAATIDFDDHADSAANATPLGVASSVLGEIEDGADEDWFVFSAVAGTKYEFTANGDSPFTNERGELSLYDTDGTTLLESDSTSDIQTVTWLAPADGDYFLSVGSRFSSFGLGTYELTAMIAADDHADIPALATPLTSSNTLGELENGDDEDWFVFTAIQGREYEFIANGNSPFTNSNGLLSLYDTNGSTLLQSNSSSGRQTITWVAPADGDYFVSMTPLFTSFGFGTYELTTSTPLSTAEFDSVAFPADGTIGVSVFDLTNSGSVEVTVEVSSGDSETFTLDTSDTANFATVINSVNTDAVVVGDGTLQVSEGDTLTVTYSDPDPDVGFGQLISTATIFTDDHGNDAANATPLGFALDASGEIQGQSDQDWFSFSAVAGLRYEFTTTLNTLNDSVLRLYDTDGVTELVFDDDAGEGLGSLLNWQAPTSGVYFLSVESFDSSEIGTFELAGLTSGAIVGNHLFYDGSSFDGDAGVHSTNDDAAIDISKSPLRTGTATFANYTNVESGITGLFIDIHGLRTDPTVDDFEFRIGNSDDTFSFDLLDVAPDVSVRYGDGDFGSDRISLIWPAGTIVDQWLQVKVLANGPGNIVGIDDIHYWGSQRGDTGNSVVDTTVDSGDVSSVSANLSGFVTVGPNSEFDLNKDGRVNSGDISAVSARFSGSNPTLQLITIPAVSQILPVSVQPETLEVAAPTADDTTETLFEFVSQEPVSPSLVLATPARGLAPVSEAETTPTFELIAQPPAESLDQLESPSPEVDASAQAFWQPANTQSASGLDPVSERLNQRLNRVQRNIDRLESKSQLSERQQVRLANLQTREVKILSAIDVQLEKAEVDDSLRYSTVDAAFSSLKTTDLSVI